ncbi:MAG: ComEC family competence protein, partial [Winogradskyella sp.]|nr:ComEC family competence protein [Winogradskyella sp.]
MKLLNFVIIKLTLSLIAGIVIAAKFDVPFSLALLITVIIVSLLGFLWFVKRKRVSKTPYFGLLSILAFIALGMLTFSSNDPRLNEEHYVNLNTTFTQKHQLVFTITERLKRNSYNDRYIANVLEINGRKSNGRLLINIPIDSTITPFNVDQSILTYGNITEIKTPLNPFQFNYAEYLSNKYIYGQVILNENNYYKLPHQSNSILGLADTIRTTIKNRLLSNGINGDPLAIINALLLGQRQDIDDTIYNNYVNAGVIHILAVSGLHVGLLLIILNYLLKPLLYFKHGKIIKLVLLILFLWSFAVIAGLSASVTRAVAMFSIVTIAY